MAVYTINTLDSLAAFVKHGRAGAEAESPCLSGDLPKIFFIGTIYGRKGVILAVFFGCPAANLKNASLWGAGFHIVPLWVII